LTSFTCFPDSVWTISRTKLSDDFVEKQLYKTVLETLYSELVSNCPGLILIVLANCPGGSFRGPGSDFGGPGGDSLAPVQQKWLASTIHLF